MDLAGGDNDGARLERLMASVPRAAGARASSMSMDEPSIRILREALGPDELRALVDAWFGDMVKYVVDVARGVVAIGGEMHADAEAVLLQDGSRQESLWGANYLPGAGPEGCIEYTALINIRPARGNRGMEVEDPVIRARIRELTFALVGEGRE